MERGRGGKEQRDMVMGMMGGGLRNERGNENVAELLHKTVLSHMSWRQSYVP